MTTADREMISPLPTNAWTPLSEGRQLLPARYWLSDGVQVWLGDARDGNLTRAVAARYAMPAYAPEPPTQEEIANMKKGG